jgi:recombination DNA repair RAD52 pathway protein
MSDATWTRTTTTSDLTEDPGVLTEDQVTRLLRPIRPGRVFTTQGQAHVAAWDIKAHLNRMFGFGGWDKEILTLDLVSERRAEDLGYKDKTGWYVTYRCTMRLTIRDPLGREVKFSEDAATGSAQNQPQLGDAHDLAVKNAVSYALKRCAVDLGDQFGLSLYNKGSRDGVVGMTLVGMPAEEPEIAVEGEGHEEVDG